MKYFFDNCISYRYVGMLRALGVDAVALRTEMPEDIDDISLFGELKGTSSVFVSCDGRQRTRQAEARALKESGVTAIYFAPFWTKMVFWQQAAWLVKHWPTIENYTTSVVQGSFAEIKANGKARAFTI